MGICKRDPKQREKSIGEARVHVARANFSLFVFLFVPSLFYLRSNLAAMLRLSISAYGAFITLFIGVACALTGGDDGAAFILGQERWIAQPLDHNLDSLAMTAHWQQRYFCDDSHYAPGGALLFNVGNEGSVTSRITIMQTGLLRTAAASTGSLVCYAEHRFYGESLPFGNESLANENLVHLTMENGKSQFVQSGCLALAP